MEYKHKPNIFHIIMIIASLIFSFVDAWGISIYNIGKLSSFIIGCILLIQILFAMYTGLALTTALHNEDTTNIFFSSIVEVLLLSGIIPACTSLIQSKTDNIFVVSFFTYVLPFIMILLNCWVVAKYLYYIFSHDKLKTINGLYFDEWLPFVRKHPTFTSAEYRDFIEETIKNNPVCNDSIMGKFRAKWCREELSSFLVHRPLTVTIEKSELKDIHQDNTTLV